jgi:predicted transcriptional regulator
MGAFAELHRMARQRAGIGLREWSRDYVGFSPTYVSRIESGGVEPSRRYVYACQSTLADVKAAEWWCATCMVPDELTDAILKSPETLDAAMKAAGVQWWRVGLGK